MKNRTRYNLHNGNNLPDKIKYVSPVATTTVNVIDVPPKIWKPNPKIDTNQWFVLMLTKIFPCTNIVVNQRLFHYRGHHDFVLVLFLGAHLYTRKNSTRISILSQQYPIPLARVLFKLSAIIGILSVKLEQYCQYSTLKYALILGTPKLFIIANQHMVFTRQKSWWSISRSWEKKMSTRLYCTLGCSFTFSC